MGNTIHYLLALILSISGVFCCAQKNYTAIKHYPKIYKDANAHPLNYYLYDAGNKSFYFLSNDKENLYVNLKFQDAEAQREVLAFGLIITVDPNGKNKKDNSITYPVGVNLKKKKSKGTEGYSRREQGPKDCEKVKQEQIDSKNEIWVTGFGVPEGEEEILIASNTEDIRGRMNIAPNNDLLYSLTIPMSRFPKSKKGMFKPFTLDIKSGAPKNENSGMHQRSSGMSPGRGMGASNSGMSGGPGGGRGGGMGGSSMSSMDRSGMGGPHSEEGMSRMESVEPISIHLTKVNLAE